MLSFGFLALVLVICQNLLVAHKVNELQKDNIAQLKNYVPLTNYNTLVLAANTNAQVVMGLVRTIRSDREILRQTLDTMQDQMDQMSALTNLYVKMTELDQKNKAFEDALARKTDIMGKTALKLESLEKAIVKVSMALQMAAQPTTQIIEPSETPGGSRVVQLPQPDQAQPQPQQSQPDGNTPLQ